jgi:WD40 repeat protein
MITTERRFYHQGGAVPLDAPSYVVRQADSHLHAALQRGEFCYVLTARQMGKSSLMGRTAARLREEGVAVVRLDLTAIGQNITPEQWYFGLLDGMGEQLGLEAELEEFWLKPTPMGPLQRWMNALRQVVLLRCPGRLVIFIDEIDAVRSLPFSTDEFFAGIRECYNRRIDDPEFARLTFCLLGVATPSDLVQDTRTTPFNIGRRIELTDFTAAEAAPLARGLARPASQAQLLLQRVLHWTGGHPYLTQRLCQAVAQDESVAAPGDADLLCERLFLSPQAQEQDDNLLFVRERLLKSEADRAALLDLYAQVRSGKRVRLDDTNQLVSILRLSGITRVDGGSLHPRNRIYERVFDREWVTAHMPDAELRRQRAAYRRGLLRATAVATAVVAVVLALALLALGQARRAEEGQRLLRRSLYAAQMSQAQQAWDAGEIARAQELLEAQKPQPGQEDLRGFEWRYLRRRLQREKPAYSLENAGASVAFSADGRIMASAHGKTATIWDAAGRRRLGVLQGIEFELAQLALSPDGRLLAAGDGLKLKLWDVATGRVVGEFKGCPSVGAVAFSPDGKKLAASDWHWWTDDPPDAMSVVKVWDVASRRDLLTIQERGRMFSVTFSPDGRMLATAGADQKIKLWNAASGKKLAELMGHSGMVLCVAFSPDGRLLASGGGDSTAKLWDLSLRREIATLQGQPSSVSSLAFSPDSKTLAMGGTNVVRLWDVATKHQLKMLRGHSRMVNVVTFSPRDGMLATASDDNSVKLWDLSGKPDKEILTDQQLIVNVAFSPDGKTLAASNGYWPGAVRSGEVKLWDPVTGRELATLWGRVPGTAATSLSSDGRTLAVARESGLVQLWEVAPRRQVAEFQGPSGFQAQNLTVALSPDGRFLALGSEESAVRLWEIASRRAVAGPRGRNDYIRFLVFSPDSKLLAWSDLEPIIRLWDLAARREVGRLTGHTGWVNRVAFSPDGKTLASTGSDRTVKMWNWRTRREIATLKGHLDRTVSVAFSPDGGELASGSVDGTVKIWNVASKLEVASFTGRGGVIVGIAFSPDGSLMAAGDWAGTVRLWRAGPPDTP